MALSRLNGSFRAVGVVADDRLAAAHDERCEREERENDENEEQIRHVLRCSRRPEPRRVRLDGSPTRSSTDLDGALTVRPRSGPLDSLGAQSTQT